MRCSCGAHALTRFTPWATTPSEAHTPERCGRFVRVAVSSDSRAAFEIGGATLSVIWADQPLEGGAAK